MSWTRWRDTFPGEEDDRCRSCTVYLHRRPIIEILAYHWSLYFDWGDYDATYEADDHDGYLIPKWNIGKPTDPEGSLKIKIGSGKFSPKKVNETAKRNKFSGKHFVLTLVNCQVWATELGKMLGFTIPIPCNLIQVVNPPLGIVLSVAHYFGFFGKKTSGSGWS